MKTITDSDLLKIAETWEKEMPINIGIKTAFAAGYRMAESKAKNCTIPDVSDTVCLHCNGSDKCLVPFTNITDDCYVCGGSGKQTGR